MKTCWPWRCGLICAAFLMITAEPPDPETLLPNAGVCSTWGDGFMKTFDGSFFQLRSSCSYSLARDCGPLFQEFNIVITRLHGSGLNIVIHTQSDTVTISNGVLSLGQQSVLVPYSNTRLHITQFGMGIKVTLRYGGVKIIWTQDVLLVVVGRSARGNMCGLCGNFDGRQELNASYEDLDLMAYEYPLRIDKACVVESGLVCSKLQTWGTCSAAIQRMGPCEVAASGFVEMCKRERCHCGTANQSQCGCASLTAFSLECGVRGAIVAPWRMENICVPQACPGDLVYTECGSTCPQTCASPFLPMCQGCVPGCFCPPETVLEVSNAITCVPLSHCNCTVNGDVYSPGAVSQQGCRSCTCDAGQWSCVALPCVDGCSLEGGSNFLTFDHKVYSFNGNCYYYLVMSADWVVEVLLRPCSSTPTERACLKGLNLKSALMSYEFKSNGDVLSSQMILPLPHESVHIKIFKKSSMFLQVATSFGLKMQVQISPSMQVYITLPEKFKGQTKGLCGNFNGIASDDFMSSQGLVEGTAVIFANSWKATSNCGEVDALAQDPCLLNMAIADSAEHKCSMLQAPAGIFSQCHHLIDPKRYYKRCLRDACSCPAGHDCVTETLFTYARACASKGLVLNGWRRSADSPVGCPQNQLFSYSGDACKRTCRSLGGRDVACTVTDVPVEGCQCPRDLYADDQGRCVPARQCPCFLNGERVRPGALVYTNGISCYCKNGILLCQDYPACNPPMVYVDCVTSDPGVYGKACEKTCELQNPRCLGRRCYPGCVCPKGLVSNRDGTCVYPDFCPCQHNGISYAPGDSLQVDCNQCNCSRGSWNCTKNYCAAICKMFGDGHYTTFDGKRFLFDGNCEYIVAQDFCGSNPQNGTFQVTVESELCSSTLSTCSKSIRFFLEDRELKLAEDTYEITHGSGPSSADDTPKFTVYSRGLYLIVEASNGIKLVWDRKTTLLIKVTPDRKNELCGLCGNYNGDVSDDFTLRDHSVSTSVLQFGNSWKAGEACSDLTEENPPCQLSPDRRVSAERQCSLLVGGVFASCHGQVDYTPYYEACVRDACLCATGLECELFCAAAAAYAEACSEVGLCINWRTPDLCPVFCDYYNDPNTCTWHYYPCGAVNTKTCNSPEGVNMRDFSNLEGCYPRCPNGAYLDERSMHCVSLENCSCDLDGETILPGNMFVSSDSRQMCICTNGQLECNSTNVYTTSTPQTATTSTPQTATTSTPQTATTVTVGTTTIRGGCYSVYPPRMYKEIWKVNKCTTATCLQNGTVSYTQTSCSNSKKPKCNSLGMVYDNDGCCSWECLCTCKGWGDPHQTTFDGVSYAFLEDCTYILLEEKVKKQNLSILIDDYQFNTANPASFVRGIIINYNGNSVNMSIPAILGKRTNIIKVLFNKRIVTPPFSLSGINIVSTGVVVTVSIPAIRATISFTGDMYTIYLPYDLFQNNTQGQCGVCNNWLGDDCAWRNGTAEPASCCTSTAASWITPDVTKPHCSLMHNSSRKNHKCTIPTPSPPCHMNMSACNAISSTGFLNCSKLVSLQEFLVTCNFDQCRVNSTRAGCPSVQAAANKCAELGFYVDWRGATNGTCGFNCSNGRYMPPGEKVVKSCLNGSVNSTIQYEEGCYCPEGTIRCNGSCISEMSKTTSATSTVSSTRTTPSTSTPTSSTTTYASTAKTTVSSTTTPTKSTPQTPTPTSTATSTRTTPPTSTATSAMTTPPASTVETTVSSTIASTTTPPTSVTTGTPSSTATTSSQASTTGMPCTCSFGAQLINAGEILTVSNDTNNWCYYVTCSLACTLVGSHEPCPTSTSPTTRSPSTTYKSASTTPHLGCNYNNHYYNYLDTWRLGGCITATCYGGKNITTSVMPCPNLPLPVCLNSAMQPVKVYDDIGCCFTWACDCECKGWGDPHYRTFDGRMYPFLEDCTYTLVEEKIHKYNLSVLVDNHYFLQRNRGSFARGIVVVYNGSSVNMSIPATNTLFTETKVYLNGQVVATPFTSNGFVVDNPAGQVTVQIPAIRALIAFTGLMFTIDLPYSLFGNNTKGQCGNCNNVENDDCTRSNGKVEPASCCAVTAATWMVPDPSKPHCTAKPPAATVPCPSTTPTPLPPCHTDTTICDIISSSAFAECARRTDLRGYLDSCKFDICMINNETAGCASLQAAAKICFNLGIYVDWRGPTNDTCRANCSPIVYMPAGPKLIASCDYSGMTIQTTVLEEGCFCPEDTKMFNLERDVCVKECGCIGPNGTPKMIGEVWNSDCMICVCDAQTRKALCKPVDCAPPPSCSPLDTLIQVEDRHMCCPIFSCRQRTDICVVEGQSYAINANWTKPGDNCTRFMCKSVLGQAAVITEKITCSVDFNISSCVPGTVVQDNSGCCSSCTQRQSACRLFQTDTEINLNGCNPKTITLSSCEGTCSTTTIFDVKSRGLLYTCNCCHELESQRVSVVLDCIQGPTRYDYISIRSCNCVGCS